MKHLTTLSKTCVRIIFNGPVVHGSYQDGCRDDAGKK